MPLAVHTENLTKVYRLGKKSRGQSARNFAPWRQQRVDEDRNLLALDDVSLTVASGETLGVIGSNGAGKSTLLKILGRVTPPTSGRATIRGRVVPLLELGRAFQPEATGRENLFINAALYGIPRSAVHQRLDDVVQFAELEEFIDEPVKRYSSGMYARLAFSVAVNMDPNVLLADEILAVGDLDFQQRCLDRIREAGALGTTVLFVSHDMDMVRRMCDRVLWLRDGRIAADGDPAEVVTAYEEATLARTRQRQSQPTADESPAKPPSRKQQLAEAGAALGEIVSVRLLDSAGRAVGTVPLNEEASISMTFRLFRGDLNVRCMIALLTESGVAAFRSPQPDAVHLAEAGEYSAVAQLPANLLNNIAYTLKVSVAIEGTGLRATLVKTDALSFRVTEPEAGSLARGNYEDELAGALRPLLSWSISRGELDA